MTTICQVLFCRSETDESATKMAMHTLPMGHVRSPMSRTTRLMFDPWLSRKEGNEESYPPDDWWRAQWVPKANSPDFDLPWRHLMSQSS